MYVDEITIIICLALFFLSVISLLTNPFFRKPKTVQNNDIDSNNISLPRISVLILAEDNQEGLHQTLSAVVAQDYQQDFEIIVVIEHGDLVAENVINTCAQGRKIYTTFVPKKSLFMSKQKLAVSLAVKAAHNEWIALLQSGCVPQSNKWLATLARNCHDEKVSIVTGYCNYSTDAPAYFRFQQLRSALYLMYRAQHKSAYSANGYNILFRKSVFIGDDGYRGNLQYRYGVCDFIVNKYARKGNTVPELSQDACVREKFVKKNWYNKNFQYLHFRKRLAGRLSMRFSYHLDLSMMYLNYAINCAAIIYSSLAMNMLLLSVSIFILVMTIVFRIIMAAKVFARFGEPMQKYKIIPFELVLSLYDMILKLKYLKSDKNDFITHKL